MRITKNGQTRVVFSCLISTLCISALQAETVLPPVAQAKLNEAPPPWAARPDVQPPPAEEIVQKTLDISAAAEPQAMPTTPSYSLDQSVAMDSRPLTLEDEGGVLSNDSIDSTVVAIDSAEKKEKKGLLGKLFSRKKKESQEQIQIADEQEKKRGLFGKLFSRKKKNEKEQVAQKTEGGIESWYQNRQNASVNNQPVENLQAQAAQGDSESQYQLGLMYRAGNGVEENVYQAIHWLTRAANANNAKAQYALAMLYRENMSNPDDGKKAVSWYRRAAQAGNADAQYSLGLLYANGDLVKQDENLAKKWFKLSSEQGNMPARIALIASEGAFTPQSNPNSQVSMPTEITTAETPVEITEQAPLEIGSTAATEITEPSQTRFIDEQKPVVQLAENAEKLEEPQEQIRVASITAPTPRPIPAKEVASPKQEVVKNIPKHTTPSVSASGVNKDNAHLGQEDADIDVAAIRRGAAAGDAESQLLLGSLYEDGKAGMPQDYELAAEWYRKAADQGFAQAQYNLGLLYEDGRGMDQDYYEAAQWYKRASNNGFSEAQNNLGVLYIMGKGVIKDRNRAELMFRRAAEQGNPNAQRNLDMLLKAPSE